MTTNSFSSALGGKWLPRFSFASLFRWLMKANERSRQRYHLRDMDDRMLCDIGLTRDEAVRESMKSFWQD